MVGGAGSLLIQRRCEPLLTDDLRKGGGQCNGVPECFDSKGLWVLPIAPPSSWISTTNLGPRSPKFSHSGEVPSIEFSTRLTVLDGLRWWSSPAGSQTPSFGGVVGGVGSPLSGRSCGPVFTSDMGITGTWCASDNVRCDELQQGVENHHRMWQGSLGR